MVYHPEKKIDPPFAMGCQGDQLNAGLKNFAECIFDLKVAMYDLDPFFCTAISLGLRYVVLEFRHFILYNIYIHKYDYICTYLYVAN
jgi:hypothetical protein